MNKCVDCEKDFEITDGEKEWYKMKNYDLPKRCKPCRQLKKESRAFGESTSVYVAKNKTGWR